MSLADAGGFSVGQVCPLLTLAGFLLLGVSLADAAGFLLLGVSLGDAAVFCCSVCPLVTLRCSVARCVPW